ncbi:MAG: Gfo/Idh/MocA family oxidoreductase [Lentimicrobiaceae bacterium]|jgi:predicted dehydrogenase
MLKIGVIGAGHLGKIHIKCIKKIPEYELMGFFDTDELNSQSVSNEFGIKQFYSIENLVREVDVVDIVTPTIAHFEHAAYAINQFRHVFIEKPIVTSPEEALKLIDIASKANVKVQVGHVERYNPAMVAAIPFIDNPMFIEIHRLAGFKQRGSDVPVILDLMIHDIDIVLYTVHANLRKISASGVAVVTNSPDIVNARLEFDNGCVANLTSSRISLSPMRKARFFQRDAYISVDFLNMKTEVAFLKNINGGTINPLLPVLEPRNGAEAKHIHFEKPLILPTNAIQTELSRFAKAILTNAIPDVTISDGYQALKVAYQILEKVENSVIKRAPEQNML